MPRSKNYRKKSRKRRDGSRRKRRRSVDKMPTIYELSPVKRRSPVVFNQTRRHPSPFPRKRIDIMDVSPAPGSMNFVQRINEPSGRHLSSIFPRGPIMNVSPAPGSMTYEEYMSEPSARHLSEKLSSFDRNIRGKRIPLPLSPFYY